MEQLKAIPTYYNGYKFRSRLEARWAVFFDNAGIAYEYEPEGFYNSDGACYLPDFYLTQENMYVEVKPPREEAWKDIKKVSQFIGNGIDTLLLLPNIPSSEHAIYYYPVLYSHPVELDINVKWCPILAYEENDVHLVRHWYDPTKRWMQFLPPYECDDNIWKHTLVFLTPFVDKSDGSFESMERDHHTGLNEYMIGLYDKARQAQFEHGVKG